MIKENDRIEVANQMIDLCDTVQEAFLYLAPHVESGNTEAVIRMIVEISHAVFALDNGQKNLKFAEQNSDFMWAFNVFYNDFLQFAKDAEEGEMDLLKTSYGHVSKSFEDMRVKILSALNTETVN